MNDAIHQSQKSLLEDAEEADSYSQQSVYQAWENANYGQHFIMLCTVGKIC